MATPLDTALIDSYTGGMNAPLASQAGFAVRANAAGNNVDYVGYQDIQGGGTWDGKSETVFVHGTGLRTIVIPNGFFKGQRLLIVDADGTAAGGDTISVSSSGGTVAGSQTITSDYDSRQYIYQGSGVWNQIAR